MLIEKNIMGSLFAIAKKIDKNLDEIYEDRNQKIAEKIQSLMLKIFSEQYNKTNQPQMKIIAGIQSTGKSTYMKRHDLKKELEGYLSLYKLEYRDEDPDYASFKKNKLTAYHNTANFISKLGTQILLRGMSGKYNILMECALDNTDFAGVSTIHNYKKDFVLLVRELDSVYLSSITRALRYFTKDLQERFLSMEELQQSRNYAINTIIPAFINQQKEDEDTITLSLHQIYNFKATKIETNRDNFISSYTKILDRTSKPEDLKEERENIRSYYEELTIEQKSWIPAEWAKKIKEEIAKIKG